MQSKRLGLLLFSLGACVSICLAQTASQQAQKSEQDKKRVTVTPDMLLRESDTFGSPALAWVDNGNQIAFSARQRDVASCSRSMPLRAGEANQRSEGSSGEEELWIVLLDVRTGQCKFLVQGAYPKPSPDGSKIAYLSGLKNPQIGVISTSGEGARVISQVVLFNDYAQWAPAENYYKLAWSPDATKIAYSCRQVVKGSEATSVQDLVHGPIGSVAVTVLTHNSQPSTGEHIDQPDTEIRVHDLTLASDRKVASGPYSTYRDMSWSPDGNLLLFQATSDPHKSNGKRFEEVKSVNLSSGEIRNLLTARGVQGIWPLYSPDGKQIAVTFDPKNPFFYSWNLAVLPVEGGSPRELARNIYIEDSERVWSPKSDGLYFRAKTGAFSQVYFVSIKGELTQLTHAKGNVASMSVSPDGKSLAWSTEDPMGRRQIWISNSSGDARMVVDLTPEIEHLLLGETEEIRWKSRDGLEIAGLLVKPINYVEGRRYPLLVDLHGGPQGGIALAGSILLHSPLEWHMWAAKGFAVLVPDYRSSGIYGWDQIQNGRDKEDFNERDFDDVVSGVDYVVKNELADADKLAVIGHSYGGYLTNWIITHTTRFKVAVSYEGWSDRTLLVGIYGTSTGDDWLFKGNPWQVPDNYRKNSSITFITAVTTPALLISGERGIANCDNQVFHTALNARGVDTQLLIYRGEGHSIVGPENQRDLLGRVLQWIDLHLKD
jgi:dipeptidyl aminopeptidase/acylaminoacyl peptidase